MLLRIRSLVIGGAVGAAAVYFLDPDMGAARRGRVLDRVRQGWQELEHGLGRLQEQITGADLDLEDAARPDDDLTVLGRVERTLYALPGFPRGSIDAEVVDGQLVLRGRVASADQEREILEAAAQVRGVEAVESLLTAPGR